MIYININTELNHMRESRAHISRTDFLRVLFEDAKKKSINSNDSVMLSGYLYKKDISFINTHIHNIYKECVSQKPAFFCRFLVNKDTQIS